MVIHYKAGRLQLSAIFALKGSVFPQACCAAIPTALLATVFGFLIKENEVELNFIDNPAAYTSFTFVVGFLLVFRNQTAYARFWEGATLMQVLRGQWVGAFGSLLAFSSESLNKPEEILTFRLKLLRMFSALHACSLDYIYGMPDGSSPIIGVEGIDDATLKLMNQADDESLIYVIIQWIQQMILHNCTIGVIPTPAPIVSRVFQDLSSGMVTVNNAKKISDTPFPFPYCQALQVALLMHAIVTPIVFVQLVSDPFAAGALTFVAVMLFQTLNFISAEIEHPFGQDTNDISMDDLHIRFNKTLVTMLSPGASKRPKLRNKIQSYEIATQEIMNLPELLKNAAGYAKVWEEFKGVKRHSQIDMKALFQNFDDLDVLQKGSQPLDGRADINTEGKYEGKASESKVSVTKKTSAKQKAYPRDDESDLVNGGDVPPDNIRIERPASLEEVSDSETAMQLKVPVSPDAYTDQISGASDYEGDEIRSSNGSTPKGGKLGKKGSKRPKKKDNTGASEAV